MAADFHGSSSAVERLLDRLKVEKPDLVLIGGDIADVRDKRETVLSLLKKLAEAGLPIFYVPGNCDPAAILSGFDIAGVTFLHRKAKPFGGYTFMGVGGSNITPFSTPIEFDEDELAGCLEEAKREAGEVEKTILLTHVPPHDTESDRIRTSAHVGSTSVRRFIEQEQPILALCAHIHEARGTDRLGKTLIVNPGPAAKGFYALIKVDGEPRAQLKEVG